MAEDVLYFRLSQPGVEPIEIRRPISANSFVAWLRRTMDYRKAVAPHEDTDELEALIAELEARQNG